MKTIEDLKKDAGEELTNRIQELFVDTNGKKLEQAAINWFYSPMPVLDGETPYELCKRGEKYVIEELVEGISPDHKYKL